MIFAFEEKYRICDCCRKKFSAGFTSLDYFYCCEDCFNRYMDSLYGKGNWRVVDDDGYDGYYEVFANGRWEGTGIFWTRFDE